MIMSSWFDRPLSAAGRVYVNTADGLEERLVCLNQDLFVIPNLAIHMNREVNDGVKYSTQTDMCPIMGSFAQKGRLLDVLAEAVGAKKDDILGQDLYLYTRQQGIVLGVEEDFTPEQYQNFIDSGLIHITSVSGMHVFVLFSSLLALFRLLHLPRKLLYPILLPILFLFSAVAAFTPSVCRSTIMMLFFVLAQFLQREPDTLTSLSASAMILLLLNPYNLTSYSFLLSFSSTLGLVLFSGTIQYYLTKPFRPKNPEEKPAAKEKPFWRERLVDPVISSLSMSAGCLLGTGFFTMRFFRRITWGSFLPNLFLLPLSAPTFVLGLINWPIYYLCPFLANIISKLPLKLMLRCINLIASLFSHPIFRFETPTPPASAIFPYIFFCTALYYTLRGSFKNNT